jgi:hypothetical protein
MAGDGRRDGLLASALAGILRCVPAFDGKLLSVDLTFIVWQIAVKVVGTVEILDVRKAVA